MGLSIVHGEEWALGNHKGKGVTLTFTGLYPAGGYDCPCESFGVGQIVGFIPLIGQNGFVLAMTGHKLQVFLHGVECAGMMVDGLVVECLVMGH